MNVLGLLHTQRTKEKRMSYLQHGNSEAVMLAFQPKESRTCPSPEADSGSGLKRIPHGASPAAGATSVGSSIRSQFREGVCDKPTEGLVARPQCP